MRARLGSSGTTPTASIDAEHVAQSGRALRRILRATAGPTLAEHVPHCPTCLRGAPVTRSDAIDVPRVLASVGARRRVWVALGLFLRACETRAQRRRDIDACHRSRAARLVTSGRAREASGRFVGAQRRLW